MDSTHLPRQGHGMAGVFAVAVGTDVIGELLRDRGAADEHLDLVADARPA